MAFVPLNFVDKIGPPIPAAWLNKLDTIQNAISANAAGNVIVAAPTSGIGLTVNGGAVVSGGQLINAVVGAQSLIINGGTFGQGGAILINLAGSNLNGIFMTGSFPAFCQPFMVKNTSNNPAAINYGVEVANDVSAHELFLFNTSTTFSGAVDTNVPAGPACGIAAGNTQFIISVATTNNATGVTRVLIDGVAGLVKLWEGTNNVAAAGLAQVATQESGSFTGTLNNCTSSPTTSVFWRRNGSVVTLTTVANMIAGSANTTAPTITGMPAALQPAPAINDIRQSCLIQDNSVNEAGYVRIVGATIFSLRASGINTFTAANNKGFAPFTVSYSID